MRDENTPSSGDYTVTLEFINSRSVRLNFYLEPWGEGYSLPPKSSLKLVATDQSPPLMEVETSDDAITIWAGGQAEVALFREGRRIDLRGSPDEADSKPK
jgi:hypothetical protein